MDKFYHCSKSASSDIIKCPSCINIIHMLCLFDSNIIDVQIEICIHQYACR